MRFTGLLKRAFAVAVLSVLLPVSALSYTLVLKNGRRVQLPDNVKVTSTTLTYDYARGVQVTLKLADIDEKATQELNGQSLASFLKKAVNEQQADKPSRVPDGTTITDRDLEKYRRSRVQSLKEYENRRVELGLPTLEESRQRQAEADEWLSAYSDQLAAQSAQSEFYWRTRARELRTSLASVDAEINYVRSRLAETRTFPGFTTFSVGRSTFPIFRPPVIFSQITGNPGFLRGVPRERTRFFGVTNLNRPQRQPRFFGQVPRRIDRRPSFRRPLATRHHRSFPFAIGAYSVGNADYDLQVALTARLYELEARRESLLAQWQLLEEEARRAGVPLSVIRGR